MPELQYSPPNYPMSSDMEAGKEGIEGIKVALRAFHVEKMSRRSLRSHQIIKRERESLLYYPSLLKALVHCAKGHWNTLVGLTNLIRKTG